MAWTVDAERMAELCDYRIAAAGNVLDRVEAWQLAGGAGLEAGKCQGGANRKDSDASEDGGNRHILALTGLELIRGQKRFKSPDQIRRTSIENIRRRLRNITQKTIA